MQEGGKLAQLHHRIEDFRRDFLLAAEGEQLPRQAAGFIRRAFDEFEIRRAR
ncbi:hypothetical protein D3C83_277460 [compost metagenome]